MMSLIYHRAIAGMTLICTHSGKYPTSSHILQLDVRSQSSFLFRALHLIRSQQPIETGAQLAL